MEWWHFAYIYLAFCYGYSLARTHFNNKVMDFFADVPESVIFLGSPIWIPVAVIFALLEPVNRKK